MNDLVGRVEQARQCWNAGDLPGYLSLYDFAIKLHGYAPEPFDKAAVIGFYQMIWSTLSVPGKPNPQLDFHEILVDQNLYCCRFAMSGIHSGAFMGVAATGRTYTLPGITIMRFGADRKTVVERWSSADMLSLLIQLGAIPPPG